MKPIAPDQLADVVLRAAFEHYAHTLRLYLRAKALYEADESHYKWGCMAKGMFDEARARLAAAVYLTQPSMGALDIGSFRRASDHLVAIRVGRRLFVADMDEPGDDGGPSLHVYSVPRDVEALIRAGAVEDMTAWSRPTPQAEGEAESQQ